VQTVTQLKETGECFFVVAPHSVLDAYHSFEL
jgi:hypothetical protein